jgi:CHAT domain-containing protein
LIPERSALVGYVSQMDTTEWDPSLRRSEAWAYVLRPDRPIAWHRLWQRNLDDGVIQDGKSPLQPEVFLARAAAWNGDLGADRDLDRCRRVFCETYIAPLLTDLSGIDTLIVDGSFPFLDLAVFPDGTLLTDRFETTYVPSALVWQTLRETSAPRTTGRALIAVASPSPTAPAAGRSLEELLPLALKERRVRQIRETIGRDSFVPGQLPDLPWAVAEVRSIAPLFGERDEVLIGEDTDRQLATLARRGELREFEVIHFAGHTLRDTLLERSALALVNRSAPPIHGLDDGLLELPEVMLGWELQAGLVTLSACESVRVSGASRDEFLGLTGPLFGRGARAVISSRWPVDDVATALLMQRFYSTWLAARAEHGRASATCALSGAKRWLRNYTLPDGSHPFEHPVFWSGFLLYGVDDGAMPEAPTSSSRR